MTLYGPPEGSPRTSTVSFTLDGFQAGQVCRALGARGLFTWDGDFYAQRLVELLGLQGVVASCASGSLLSPTSASGTSTWWATTCPPA